MALASKQSEKSRQTDLKVAQSAAKSVRTVGVDQMALTRVAADAGFSSGVIYARCDDRSELVVLAWEKSFWPMLSEMMSLLIEAVITKNTTHVGKLSELFQSATAPDAVPDLGSAMEIIVASRRDEVIGEVIHRDIAGLFEDFGVGPATDGANRQAAVAAVSSLFGAALLNSAYNSSSVAPIDPTVLFELFSNASTTATKPARRTGPLREATPYVFPSTHDDIRDALIAAGEYVIARSGVHRATVSRIARRAGVSVGAIYSLYENKDSLVEDCVEVLYPPQSIQDAKDWARVFTADDQRAMITEILTNYMSDSYKQWRQFRLECLVAARHSPDVAQQLTTYATRARTMIFESASRAPQQATIRLDTGMSARAGVIGLSIMEIVDPTICQLDWRWVPVR
ncbi:MAG: Bacterial regulatory protein tetR family [Actinomycetota bacterium]|jgi:AcrR family transcriptional regulator